MTIQPALLETHEIRRFNDKEYEPWGFSVVEIRQLLTQQPDSHSASKYWYNLP